MMAFLIPKSNCFKIIKAFDYYIRISFILSMFSKFGLDVIFSCFFGYSTDMVNQPDSELGKNVQKMFEDFKSPAFMFIRE